MRPLHVRLRHLVAAALLAAGALAADAAAAQVSGPRYYLVVNGDTLWSIAQRHRVSASELAERNHLADPSALRRGMRLRLPSRAVMPEAPAPVAAAAARPAARPPAPAAAPPSANHREGGGRWGRASHPGVVSLMRVGDGNRLSVDLRRAGPVARGRMRAFLHASNGATHPIDVRLLRQLAQVSDHFGGRTLEVVSGFRPRRRQQFTPHSRHNLGHAVDFRVQSVPNRVVRDYCRTLPDTGCGFYPRSVFIHMDTRDESAYWVDWSRPGERPRYGSESHPPPERRPPAPNANPTDTPDPSVPPVGADPEVNDVADDTPSIRGAASEQGHDDDAPAAHDDAPATRDDAPTP